MFRPITLFPFPTKRLEELSKNTKKFLDVEMNMGQYFLEVDRVAGKRVQVDKYGKVNGELIKPEEIVDFIKEVRND